MDYRKGAEIIKALSHPTRLMILECLLDKNECVQDMQMLLKKRQANVSQHLAILKNAGLIDYIQEGKKRCYFIRRKDIAKKIIGCIKAL